MLKIKVLIPLLTAAVSSCPFLATACVVNKNQTTILNTNLNAASYVKLTFSNGDNTKVSFSGETVFKVKSGKTFGTIATPTPKHSDGLTFKNWIWVSGQPTSKTVGDIVEDTDVISSAAVVKPMFVEKYDVVYYTDVGYFTKAGTSIGKMYVVHNADSGSTLADAFDSSKIDLVTDTSSALYGLPKVSGLESWRTCNKYKTGSTTVTGSTLISDNMEVKTNLIAEFTTCTWEFINSACTEFEASDQDATAQEAFYSKFSINGTVCTSMDDFVGAQRSILINGLTHKFRVIDTQHDLLTNQPSGKTTAKAALTFDAVTLLTYSDGYQMTSMYDTSSGIDYPNSVLRKNLTGQGTATLQWYNSSGVQTSETRTALMMLPDDVQSVIKTVTKSVAMTSSFTVGTYNDKLFPLSVTEMANTGTRTEGSAYKYWKDHNTDADRNKKDASGNGSYRLVSPHNASNGHAWHISSGEFGYYMVYHKTIGVSIAFCV